jgi:uncharacterized protein YjeT (DUF2065 family)
MPTTSIILIIGGIVYLVKPDIFRRGIWKKTAITQQIFSEKNYLIYMRILGGIIIAIGIIIWMIKK